jgi:hypothetical protein
MEQRQVLQPLASAMAALMTHEDAARIPTYFSRRLPPALTDVQIVHPPDQQPQQQHEKEEAANGGGGGAAAAKKEKKQKKKKGKEAVEEKEAEAGQQGPSEEERDATLKYVLQDLPAELFTELFQGFHFTEAHFR